MYVMFTILFLFAGIIIGFIISVIVEDKFGSLNNFLLYLEKMYDERKNKDEK